MRYEIRPLTFTEIVDVAFRMLRNHFKILIGIPLIVYAPVGLIMGYGISMEQPVWIILAALPLAALQFVIYLATTYAAASLYLGHSVTIASSYRDAFRIFLPAFGTTILFYLALFAAGLMAFVLALINPIIGIGVGIALLLFVVLRWALLQQVMAIERRFGLTSFRRSEVLTKGVRGRVVGLYLVLAIITLVIGGTSTALSVVNQGLSVSISMLEQGIGMAYLSTMFCLFYFDQRCVKEDFDIHYMAQAIGTNREPATPTENAESDV